MQVKNAKNTTLVEQSYFARYNVLMNKPQKLAKKTHFIRFDNISSVQAAKLLLAIYVLVFLISQLFTFEKLPALIAGSGLELGWANLAAISLVLLELAALPFLLGMRTSPLISRVSFASVFLALTGLAALEVLSGSSGQSMILGATFDLPGGSWSLSLLAALWILAIWSAYGSLLLRKSTKSAK